MNYPEPSKDEKLWAEHTRVSNVINDLLIPFQDSAYKRGLEVAEFQHEAVWNVIEKAKKYVDAYYYFHPVQGEEGDSLIKDLKDALQALDPMWGKL